MLMQEKMTSMFFMTQKNGVNSESTVSDVKTHNNQEGNINVPIDARVR